MEESRSVRAVSIARSEHVGGAPRVRGPSGVQAAMAALDNQMVMWPRPIRARS